MGPVASKHRQGTAGAKCHGNDKTSTRDSLTTLVLQLLPCILREGVPKLLLGQTQTTGQGLPVTMSISCTRNPQCIDRTVMSWHVAKTYALLLTLARRNLLWPYSQVKGSALD